MFSSLSWLQAALGFHVGSWGTTLQQSSSKSLMPSRNPVAANLLCPHARRNVPFLQLEHAAFVERESSGGMEQLGGMELYFFGL